MPIKVIIVGANGLLGRHLVSTFTSDSYFQISILTRQLSPNGCNDLDVSPEVSIYTVSAPSYDAADPANLVQILRGQDVLISTLASLAVSQQKPLIDAAIEAGVKHFIPSEFGFDSRCEPAQNLLPAFLCKGKREIIEYLELKRTEGSGINWTAFVTGPFVETSIPSYLGFELGTKQATLFQDRTSCWSTTTLSTAALAVKNALLLPREDISNRYLFVESFNICQGDILAGLQEVTGARWDVQYCDPEEEKRVGLERLARGDCSGIGGVLQYAVCTPGHGADYTEYEEKANGLLRLPEVNLKDVLAGFLIK